MLLEYIAKVRRGFESLMYWTGVHETFEWDGFIDVPLVDLTMWLWMPLAAYLGPPYAAAPVTLGMVLAFAVLSEAKCVRLPDEAHAYRSVAWQFIAVCTLGWLAVILFSF